MNQYETLYQTEQLYRIPDERWGSVQLPDIPVPTTDVTPEVVEVAALLNELDELLAKTTAVDPEPAVILEQTEEIAEPVALRETPTTPEPKPVAATERIEPEPLPKTTPRPTVPPVVAPPQQVQTPKLNHKVLLLADEELDPSNLLFLEKILNAVNLNIDGVDLLNLNGVRDVDFAELVHGKLIHHFITFGVPFSRIHLDILMDRYQPVRFFGINFLMADSLPTIEADVNLKKRLWAALQQVFAPQ